MNLKSYFLEHAPSPKDKNRYKLNLSCEEKDVKELVRKLSSISSRPFPSTDKNFNWSFYLYDLTVEMRDKLKSELDKVVSVEKNSVGSEAEHKKIDGGKGSSTKTTRYKAGSTVLNKDYIFESFVVGASTRFTYAACKSVAESPGKNYNPLFIYGGVGLGKTHLMHSIGNHVREKYPDNTISYIKTDEFIREVVDAIERGAINEMRMKYKSIDLLLIDDIQFLEKSDSTQEEFFHIFNEMYEVGKQIVITSDKPPKKLTTLEDRLKSRFEWGLTTDIKVPNFETRKAIIKKKSVKVGINITDEISDYISQRLTSNVRELEGIINRIYAYQQFSEQEITMDFIKDIIRNILPEDEEQEGNKEKAFNEKSAQNVPQQYAPPQQLPPVQQGPGYVMPPHQAGNICSSCGRQTTYVPQYQKWFCTFCGIYIENVQPFIPQYQPPQNYVIPPPQTKKMCSKCNSPLMYVQEYNRYYCNSCKAYESVSEEKQPVSPGLDSEQKKPDEPEIKDEKSESKVSDEEIKKKIAKDDKSLKKEKVSFEERVIGEEKKNVREIRAGYFLPEGAGEVFETIIDKLGKLTTQKKFNFYIKPQFTQYYSPKLKINFNKFAHMAVTNGIDILICLKPDKDLGMDVEVFKSGLTEAMEKENMPFEIISQEDMKESNALNFMLDIAICAKKR